MKTSSKKSAPEDDLIYDLDIKTKEEALKLLYQAGIVTKNGKLRKFYRNTSKPKAV